MIKGIRTKEGLIDYKFDFGDGTYMVVTANSEATKQEVIETMWHFRDYVRKNIDLKDKAKG